jgi:hypothetical protein
VNPTDWDLLSFPRDLSYQLIGNAAASAAPEPGTLALLGLGMVVLIARRRAK